MPKQERSSTPSGDTFKPGDEYWPQPAALDTGAPKEFPLIDGKSKEELITIARGLGRTTHTGARSPSGSIISLESRAIEQMIERNRLKDEGGEQNG
jgi:hypothetical protein